MDRNTSPLQPDSAAPADLAAGPAEAPDPDARFASTMAACYRTLERLGISLPGPAPDLNDPATAQRIYDEIKAAVLSSRRARAT